MKKITLLFSMALIASFLTAQITITDSDMPSAGDTVRLSATTNVQGYDPALTGANYTWNYINLTPLSQQLDTFFSVSSTPFAYQLFFNNNLLYPNHKADFAKKGPDLGVTQVPITNVYNYTKNSSTAYDNVGFGAEIISVPSSTRNIPVDREYVFPMNYGDNHVSNSEFDITVPTFGFYGQTMERIDTVDGWGMLTTPYGTFNCLRVKSILNKVDTIYTASPIPFGITIPRPEEIEYKWLAAGMGVPVLKIVTSASLVTSIEYIDSLRLVGLPEYDVVNQLNVYPNPVKENLSINFYANSNKILKVVMNDLLGKNVATIYNGSVSTGNNSLNINMAQYSLNSGLYLLEFIVEGQLNATQKIMVE